MLIGVAYVYLDSVDVSRLVLVALLIEFVGGGGIATFARGRRRSTRVCRSWFDDISVRHRTPRVPVAIPAISSR